MKSAMLCSIKLESRTAAAQAAVERIAAWLAIRKRLTVARVAIKVATRVLARIRAQGLLVAALHLTCRRVATRAAAHLMPAADAVEKAATKVAVADAAEDVVVTTQRQWCLLRPAPGVLKMS